MHHCFLCGRPIRPTAYVSRRKVRTGEWLRRAYRNGKVSSASTHFGKRVVCSGCAGRLDRQERLKHLLAYLPELVILAGAFLAFLLR